MMKLIRVTTVPTTLESFCKGFLRELADEGYEVVAISSGNTVPGCHTHPTELERFAAGESVRHVAVEMERRISPLRDMRSLWRMWRVLRRERPTIVHSMTPKAGLITMLAAWAARVPVRIHTFTGLVFPTATGMKRRILMATDRLTCACATHIIPEGKGVKADLLNHGITRKPLRVLGHGNVRGVDLDYWQMPIKSDGSRRTSKAGGGDEFRFVFVGRVVGDKGINELVRAFTRLHSELQATRLTLVGHEEATLDPIAPATRQLIAECDGIDAVGEQADVRSFYAEAHALVFPSYREGFPNVVLEAGAMGLPAIVTDINGSREIIIEGQNGTIIPPRDEEALFQAMRSWATHPDEVAVMASHARPLVASRFEQTYVRQCLKEFYAESLTVNPHRGSRTNGYFLKRPLGFCIALAALMALSPFLLIVTAWLHWANKGAGAFFLQERPGKDGKIFRIIKFKTMTDERDADGNLLPDEERLTRVGRFVRSTSIDELPQLINVVKGDMALIGPRPLLVKYLPLYSPQQARRHEVRPGITGWAQCHGRNAISWGEKFNLDVWYVDHCTFKTDVQVLLTTIKKVFIREGISQEGNATMEAFNGNN